MDLIIRNGPDEGMTIPIGTEPVVVGRHSEATVPLDDKKVSRQHAVIERTPDGTCVLRDLDSTNHTFLNDKPIRTAVLEEGDVIRIGATEFGVVGVSIGAPATPVENRSTPVEPSKLQILSDDPEPIRDPVRPDVEISLEMNAESLRAALKSGSQVESLI